MFKSSVAGVALSLASLAASAADLPYNAPAAAPPTSMLAPNWDGVYLGVSAAHSLGNVAFKLQDTVELNGFGTIGPSIGVLAGYNKTFNDRWLVGLEMSGALSDNAANAKLSGGADYIKAKAVTDWDASIATRFGVLVSPTTLAYTSVGATVVHGKGSFTLSQAGSMIGDTAEDYFYGVGFAAFGVETQISGGWRARFEYVTSLLRTNVYRDNLKVEVSPQIGTAKLALVYGFGGQTGAKQAASAPSWTGLYAGGGLGRNHSISEYDLGLANAHLTVDGLGATGWSGSALAGYNYQINNQFVVGAELVGTLSTSKNRYVLQPNEIVNAVPETTGVVGKNNAWVSARLRGGFLINPETMAYGLVGFSKVHSELKTVGTVVIGGLSYDEKYKRNAIELGGGLETWVSDKVTMRIEYAFANLERVNVVKSAPMFGSLHHRQSTGLMAAAYHF